jgi:hypothetical protein
VDEIIRLHNAGLSVQSLLLVVSASDTPDTLSTADLTKMIEAQVPDTVVGQIVAKADAVMEDWKPVNLDSEIKGRTAETETEVYNVYPGWGGYTGWPGYGWCGTYNYYGWPYYGWYDPWWGYPYGGVYLGYGYGGFSIGFGFGGGYCGYYDPWYWGGGYCGGGYWGGGYCGHWDDGYNGYNSYRVIDRADYHSGSAHRSEQRGVAPTPYRHDQTAGTGSDTRLATADGRTTSTFERKVQAPDRQIRTGTVDPPTTRSGDDLKGISTQPTDKTTLAQADKGGGRYAIKGGDTQIRDDAVGGRTLGTLGSKFERSQGLQAQTPGSDRSVRNEVQRGIDRGADLRQSGTDPRLGETTRGVTRQATAAQSFETTGEKVDRYVRMKQAQQGYSGTSRQAGGAGRAVAPSGSASDRSGSRGRALQPAEGTHTKSSPARTSGGKSSTREAGRSSGGSMRSAPTAGSPSRSGGASFGGGRSGGGMSRGGGGGSRGGGGGRGR